MTRAKSASSLTAMMCGVFLLMLSGVTALGQTPAPVQPTVTQVQEERLFRQIDSLMFMIKLGAGVVAFVGAALTAWGIGSYRVLLRDVRHRLGSQVRDLEKTARELASNLDQSKTLVKEAQESLGIHQSVAPAVLLAQAQECLSLSPPDIPKAVALVSQIARDSGASSDELAMAGMMAREMLGSQSLAKRLLELAVKKGRASDLAKAIHAELCARDPDWKTHEQTLKDVVARNPYDEALVKAAANFYIERDDWPGLEETMRDAAQRAPWLSAPHRCRARAAEKMRRNHADIVAFCDQAVACGVQCRDDQAFSWYANYLFNNGEPRSDADSDAAVALQRRALNLDPSDGRIMAQLGRVLLARNQIQEGIQWLQTAAQFVRSSHERREIAAILAGHGIRLDMASQTGFPAETVPEPNQGSERTGEPLRGSPSAQP